MNPGKLSLLFLILLCLFNAFLILPTINDNVDNPNLIAYLSADEAYVMEFLWRYYSGKKSDSHLMDVDYGVEWLYVSDFARLVLSRFMEITPGVLILLLRWIHFISWICALAALWYFTGYHFKEGWQQTMAVLLLATRPAVDYMFSGLKPEPLILLTMIAGFHFTLMLVEKPGIKYMLLSVLCASAAFAIKFAGIFLLPAIITAMYFTRHKKVFPAFRHSWLLEFFTGLSMAASPFLFIFLYVRKSTGHTFYEEFGIAGSFLKYKAAFLMFFAGIAFLLAAAAIFFLNKHKKASMIKIMGAINHVNSYALYVSGLFFVFLFLISFKWIFFKLDVIRMTYVFHFFNFTGLLEMGRASTAAGFFKRYLEIVLLKIRSFDLTILFLLASYLGIEIYSAKQRGAGRNPGYRKRMTLAVMIVPVLLSMLTPGRFMEHHMLPFIVAAGILVIQGLTMLRHLPDAGKAAKNALLFSLSILFALGVLISGHMLVRQSIERRHRDKEDIVFEIEKWWRANIPLEAIIASDHPTQVYVPPEYKNVSIFTKSERKLNKAEQLSQFMRLHRPEFLYYTNFLDDENRMPPIEVILPGKRVRLLKSFLDPSTTYRDGESEYGKAFFIYEILR